MWFCFVGGWKTLGNQTICVTLKNEKKKSVTVTKRQRKEWKEKKTDRHIDRLAQRYKGRKKTDKNTLT